MADILEEAGRPAEKLLLDAAERAQEAIDRAEAEAAEIISAAEAQAGEVQAAARQDAERQRAEGARAAKETRQAAEALRVQPEQEAHNLLEEARAATDQLWKATERECMGRRGRDPALGGAALADPGAARADVWPAGVGPGRDPSGD